MIMAKWSDSNPRGYVLTMLCSTHDATVFYTVAGGAGSGDRDIVSLKSSSISTLRLISPTPHLPPKGGIWACELPGDADGRL